MKFPSQNLRLFLIIIFPFIGVLILGLSPQADRITDTWNRVRLNQGIDSIQNNISNYKFLLSQQPWQTVQWRELVKLQNEANDVEGVIVSYHHLQENDELTVGENIRFAEAYFQTNQVKQAFQILEKISERKLLPEEYKKIVTLQQENYDWYAAYLTLLKWNENDPQNAFMLYHMGLSQLIFDPVNASDTLIQAVTNDTNYSSRVRGIQAGLEGITHQENTTYRLVLSGQLLSQQAEWHYACAAYEYATQSDPQYAEGWALLGNALKFINKDGFYALDRAQKLDPNSKIVNEMLAIYWREHDDASKSLAILNQLADEEPSEAFWRYEIGNSLVYQGELYDALAAFIKATELAPEDSFYWLSLAQFTIDYKISMDSVGLSAARQALVLDPENGQAFDVLGVIFLNLENFASAERFLIQAIEKQPFSSLVHLHLGQLYFKTGEKKDAIYHFQQSINLAQNYEIKAAAKNYLSLLK
jgi:tetratricopeptide (TPR) repeat protein